MGQLSLALTYLGFGILFSNWGFGNLLIRDITRDRSKISKYLSNFIIARIVLVTVTILILNRIPFFLDYSEQTITVIRIISLSLISTTIVNLCYSTLVAYESLKGISIVYIVTSILRLLLSGLAIYLRGDIIQIAYIYLAIELLVLFFSIVLLFKRLGKIKFSFDAKFIWSQLIKAFPFLWIGMLMMLDSRAETVIISYFFNESYVGYYSASNTILGAITVFSEAIRNTIYPVISKYYQSSKDNLKKFVHLFSKYILILLLPLTIGVYHFSDEIISIVFSSDYILSISMLKIIIWTSISYSFSILLSGLLIYENQEKKVAFALLLSGALTLILDLTLAPLFGVVVIATVRVLSSFLQLGLLSYFHYKASGFGLLRNKTFFLSLISGLTMLGVILLLTSINTILSFVISIIIYFTILLITGVLKNQDKNLLTKLSKEILRDKGLNE